MRPHGRATVDARSPRAFGVCDKCGFLFNHNQLQWQFQWAGTRLQNLQILVCQSCLDVPQTQLKSIIIPPDPVPISNPRPELYNVEVFSFMNMMTGPPPMATSSGIYVVTEIDITPDPSATGAGYLSP